MFDKPSPLCDLNDVICNVDSEEWLFVYGTLRVGQGNYRMIEHNVLDIVPNVRVPGRLWYAFGDNSYPVARFLKDGTGHTIIGDAVLMDTNTRGFINACLMEFRAGYTMNRIYLPAEVCDYGWGFHYPSSVNDKTPIDNGDWANAKNR